MLFNDILFSLHILYHQKNSATMMTKLPNASSYDSFAFRISLLRLFLQTGIDQSQSGKKGRKLQNDSLGHSTHGRQPQSAKMELRSRSVHGNNVWDSWKKGGKKLPIHDSLGSSMHF